MTFETEQTKSTVFLLENDQVWDYYIVPASPPENWIDDGFKDNNKNAFKRMG